MKTLASPHQQLLARFDRLSALEDCWYQGRGVAPDKERLEFVAHQFSASYPEKLALLLVTPTPQGNLLFEWQAPGSPSVDLELSSLAAEFHAFAADGGDIERDFMLRSDQDWQEFFAFLITNVHSDVGAQ